jgi:hypothetical protein
MGLCWAEPKWRKGKGRWAAGPWMRERALFFFSKTLFSIFFQTLLHFERDFETSNFLQILK